MSPETIQLIVQILGGVAIILFLVAISMSYKSWKAHTIILVFLVFCGGVTLFWFSVMTLKTHQQWRQILHGPPGKPDEGLIAQAVKLEDEIQRLNFGELDDEGEVTEDGIVQLEAKIREVLYDRGRVWRECKPSPMAGNSGTVQVAVSNPTPHQLSNNLILYVFDSKPLSQDGAFVGEFKVTNVAGGGAPAGEPPADGAAPAAAGPAILTMQPAWQMTPFETNRLVSSANRGGPWLMYDKMPADGHFVFASIDEAKPEEFGVAEADLANLDRAARLAKVLPDGAVSEYVKDMQPADGGDPPSRRELYVKFEDDFPKQAFGDRPDQYKKRQKVWVPQESRQTTEGEMILGANDLVNRGIAELVEDESARFARELRDYAYIFHDIYVNRGRRRDNQISVQFDTDAVNVVLQDKQAVVATYEAENARLNHDKTGFQRDEQILTNLLTQVTDQWNAANERLTQLRDETVRMAAQLDAMQTKAVDAINRRSPAPQASVGRPTPVASLQR